MSLKDVVVEISELHELTQSSMEKVFQALWLRKPLPKDLAMLATWLQGAHDRIKTWKVLAYREGTWEAWAMAKTHYRSLKTEELAKVGPKGRKGKEIKPRVKYKNVMAATHLSEQDY